MVALDDRLCARPSRGVSRVDPRESIPVILGMPAEFLSALQELDGVGSTDERSRLECIAHVAEVLHVTANEGAPDA